MSDDDSNYNYIFKYIIIGDSAVCSWEKQTSFTIYR